MNYDVIINAELKKFKETNGFIKTSDDTVFELFMNQIIAKNYKIIDYSSFDDKYIVSNVGGGNDCGLDGIFIFINNKAVFSIQDVDDIVGNASSIEVEFVFIQSKNKTNLDTSEMGMFFSGIKNFVREKQVLKFNSRIGDLLEIKNYILSEKNLPLLKAKPSIRTIYAYKGKNLGDPNVLSKIDEYISETDELGYYFKNVEILDGEAVFNLIRKTQNRLDITIEYRDSFELLDTPNVDSSLVILCSAKNLIELLVDSETKNIRRDIFKDNIRDYQGETTANREIFYTVKNNPNEFCLLNNGITIVCSKCITSNRKITLNDPQIVNGCQTCSSIYKAYCEELDISNINLIVKVIATTNANVI